MNAAETPSVGDTCAPHAGFKNLVGAKFRPLECGQEFGANHREPSSRRVVRFRAQNRLSHCLRTAPGDSRALSDPVVGVDDSLAGVVCSERSPSRGAPGTDRRVLPCAGFPTQNPLGRSGGPKIVTVHFPS
jgi:hypothetical protein